ncbi:helix-turn-helix transcriptional regulator [Alloalcanivorax gelatiniphagus]|uniref:AlpA family phage regulatory protein n=1 Tax=Alloalcanivorax gelatiniphagus TaxID=1194167 RepID=A0ABY2XMI7_9GAMM|nr:AlpA family phage regulatory protein [Alloalcanivorax gelatiniphagus]TMW12569.1 AlpA family phage regulatory protein [Alloalcanivorax gelatiniphagus]
MSRQAPLSTNLAKEIQVIRRPEVERLTGLSRSTIYAKMDPKSAYFDPSWPKKVSLGRRSVGWYRHEIIEWVESRTISAAREA